MSLWQQQGQSVLEVILALAIFALLAAVLVSLSLGGFDTLSRASDYQQSSELAEEGLEAVRAIRDGAWNELRFNQSAIAKTSAYWQFSGEGTVETLGKFTRELTFQTPCRDQGGAITDCLAGSPDRHSRLVEAVINWTNPLGGSSRISRQTLLSNWSARDWRQTDWSGGAGQAEWADETRYESDDGNLTISSAGQLALRQESAPAGSINPGFETGLSPWLFKIWDQEEGEVSPFRRWRANGGRPGAYAAVTIPANAARDTIGAYWEQAIEIEQNDLPLVCSTDWRVVDWRVSGNRVDDFRFMMFLESTAGEPKIDNAVWASPVVIGQTSWESSGEVDCRSAAPTPGTYYFKVAVWLGARAAFTGPITVGFDNAQVTWPVASYATTGELLSSAFDLSDTSPVQLIEWSEAVPICSPECRIRFQLRTAEDLPLLASAPWSADLTVADGELIDPSLNGGRFAQYRVFLDGDGRATPVLEEVKINYK